MKEKVIILGAGESGTGSAILAMMKGYDVFVSDRGTIKDKYRADLDAYAIKYEEGEHSIEKLLKADLIIKSPGIAGDKWPVNELIKAGKKIISEIEFAGKYTKAKKICITGSNGKTTTTNLIYDILKRNGLNVALAGNIGISFARQVATGNYEYYVIELSSFQLDGMYEFKADIAVLMNITPDHLDRYGNTFQEYINSKFRVINNQTSDDYLIYWADDPVILKELSIRSYEVQLMPFSEHKIKGMAGYIENNDLNLSIHNKTERIMTIYDLALKGRHNTYNSMAAAIAGKILNIRKEIIRESLTYFQGVEHRLETVIAVHGINFINDSKATNVNSSWYALECMTNKVVWIAGGVDKGNDYSELHGLAKERIKAIVCLGKENNKLIDAFKGIVPTIVETMSMPEAVKSAYYLASTGDTVLLSPACASFDLFDNYEDRGRKFKEAVRNL
ncbi:MAG TPA: UDP-N-acetylmuramoyl-L-alanine--D-glutamate ligase [Bacteroidales bacterium]|nr:UDP-N-acetylmuramoyl-L-alanine--D-glutamate ligase [Bacteroidales bacterium]